MALWSGRFEEGVSEFTQRFGASLPVDKQLYAQDIAGSRAHAAMLAHQGVISQEDADKIDAGLERIKGEIEAGNIAVVVFAYALIAVCAIVYFAFLRDRDTGCNADEKVKR